MAVKLQVKIDLEGQDNTKKAFRAVIASAEDVYSKITAISTAYTAFGSKLAGIFSGPIEDAAKAEQVNNRLATSIELAGIKSKGAYKEIQEFADRMKKLGGIEDEVVKKVIATNVAMGMTVDQAEATSESALGLAKYMQVDLVTANEMLTMSLNGNVKALRAQFPEITALTQAQNRHGAAIDFVGDKLRKFASSDAKTTIGAFERLKIVINDASKGLAEGFLGGLNLGGSNQNIENIGAQLQAAVDKAHPAMMKLGEMFSKMGTDTLTKFANNINAIVLALQTFVFIVSKLNNLFNILSSFMNYFVILVGSIGSSIMGLVKVMANLMDPKKMWGDTAGAKKAWDDFTQDQDKWRLMGEKNASLFGDQTKALLGLGEAGKKAGDQVAAGQAKAGGDNRSGKRATGISLAMSDEQKQFQLGQQRQINDEMMRLELEQHSAAQAEFAGHMAKLVAMEEDAARQGTKISSEANNLREVLRKEYYRKLNEEYITNHLNAAKAAGDTTAEIELQYRSELRSYAELLDNKKMLDSEYQAAVEESGRKRSDAMRQTSGSASTDSALSTASGLVSAAQSGLNSIIGQIGQMFGPAGQLIAGIIQFFNMTKEQFKSMLDGLVEAMANLPQHLLDNMDYLIAKIPEILAVSVAKSFDIHFWEEVASGLWHALLDMFKNFWSILFGGQLTTQAAAAKKTTEKFLGFGPDDANAGEGKFKIKDVSLAQNRKAKDFEDSFTDTVQEGGKSLAYYLKQAIQDALQAIAEFFENTIGAIFTQIQTWGEKFKEWGANVWHGLLDAAGDAGAWFRHWGGEIWNGFKDAAADAIAWMNEKGGAIWNGFVAAIGDIGAFFRSFGSVIWDGLKDAINFSTFGSMGKTIWQSFTNSISSTSIKDMGKNMWNGFMDGLNAAWDGIKKMFAGLIPGTGGGGGGYIGQVGGKIAATFNKGGPVTSGMSNPSLARAFAAMGALHFASGGTVPGSGFSDTVPAILAPGEHVLNRDQVSAMSGGGAAQPIVFNFNVAAGAKLDRDAVREIMPQIIDNIRRESRNGTVIVTRNGIG